MASLNRSGVAAVRRPASHRILSAPLHRQECRQSLRTPRSVVAVRSLRFLSSTESAAKCVCVRFVVAFAPRRGTHRHLATRGSPDPARERPSPRVLVAALLRAASCPCCGSLRAAWPVPPPAGPVWPQSARPAASGLTAQYAVRSGYAGRRHPAVSGAFASRRARAVAAARLPAAAGGSARKARLATPGQNAPRRGA